MGRNTGVRQASAIAAAWALVFSAGTAIAQQVYVTRQGPWEVTMATLPGGTKAHAINSAGEVVGEGVTPEGFTIRPIWLDGAVIGTFTGIAGNPYSWDTHRNAVGVHIVNSKIACNVWWSPMASGQIDACTGSAYDINESGESAGSARFTTPVIHRHVVTWRAGAVARDLGLPPGAREAQGAGINNRGDVVGNLTDDTTGRIEAFVHRDGVFTRLQSLPGPYPTYAWDINNLGDIVGTSNGGTPVIWKAGSTVPTVLPVPAGRYPRSVARINDRGDIVGTATGLFPVSNSAVLWRNGEFIDLGVLPTGTEAYAYDINETGLVVGTSNTGDPYGWHAVTWAVASVPVAGADLALALTGAPDPVRRGGRLVYTLVVTNDGPEPGDGIVLTDTLPSAVSLLRVRSTQGSCAGTSTVTCTLGTLAPGQSATITLTTRARANGPVTNAAQITATTPDPDSTNNAATVTTRIGR